MHIEKEWEDALILTKKLKITSLNKPNLNLA